MVYKLGHHNFDSSFRKDIETNYCYCYWYTVDDLSFLNFKGTIKIDTLKHMAPTDKGKHLGMLPLNCVQ